MKTYTKKTAMLEISGMNISQPKTISPEPFIWLITNHHGGLAVDLAKHFPCPIGFEESLYNYIVTINDQYNKALNAMSTIGWLLASLSGSSIERLQAISNLGGPDEVPSYKVIATKDGDQWNINLSETTEWLNL